MSEVIGVGKNGVRGASTRRDVLHELGDRCYWLFFGVNKFDARWLKPFAFHCKHEDAHHINHEFALRHISEADCELVHIIDESKAFLGDFRYRALRHHAEGIFLAEKLFGVAIVNSDGNQVPVRYVGEQHVREDLGRIPTAQDWLLQIKPQRWMYGQRLDEEMTITKEDPI